MVNTLQGSLPKRNVLQVNRDDTEIIENQEIEMNIFLLTDEMNLELLKVNMETQTFIQNLVYYYTPWGL